MKMFYSAAMLLLVSFPAFALGSNDPLYKRIKTKYAGAMPKQWSQEATGLIRKIDTKKKILALTFDLCGGNRDSLDYNTVAYLTKEQIPATIFVSGLWIAKHPEDFKFIAANPLFEIENHGTFHRPASINGKNIYRIHGTKNIDDLILEIDFNADKIQKLTGRRPLFYRAGTAYYDEYAVKIAQDLGQQPAGYSLLGDDGAKYRKNRIKRALLAAQPGDIIILHLNRPKKQTGAGLIAALPVLKEKGFSFVKLEDYKSSFILND
jgi:peptidoglycan/xylan/chitin deacetylase (PgdA/CDA1 family)